MKFDLHRALEGAPVKLKNGKKAFIYASMPNHVRETLKQDKNYVLVGAIIESSGECLQPLETWTEDGSYIDDENILSNNDIVSIW
jgi:hypothetical protein